MKNSLLFCALVIFLSASASIFAQSRVVTRAELRTEGVAIRRIRHDTPMASHTLETAVVRSDALALYQLTECIVLKQDVAVESLNEVDSGIRAGASVERRVQSEKDRAVFLVRGQEVTRAYLAFTFAAATKTPGGEPKRLLLPVSAAMVRETGETPNPTTTPDANSAAR